MNKASVLIVEDEGIVRNALDQWLRLSGFDVSMAGSAREALAQLDASDPEVVVSDVRMPSHSGLELLKAIHEKSPATSVVLITGHGDVPMSVRAMKAGAIDFLPKPFRDQDLLDAVTTAIERDRRRRAVDGGANELRDRFLTLSPREQQVMLLVTTGKMNKQVAGEFQSDTPFPLRGSAA